MTRKNKIITSVAVLSMAIFGMILGVYALVQRQVSINGTVSFSASTVRATFTVSKTEAYTGETMGALTQVGAGTFNETNQNNATAELGNIMLSDNTERFAYQVTITSTETVRDLFVSYTVPAPTQNWISVLVDGQENPTTTTATITAGQTLTVTFVVIANGATAPETAENIEIGSDFVIGLSQEDSQADFNARMNRQAQRQNNVTGYENQNNQNVQEEIKPEDENNMSNEQEIAPNQEDIVQESGARRMPKRHMNLYR